VTSLTDRRGGQGGHPHFFALALHPACSPPSPSFLRSRALRALTMSADAHSSYAPLDRYGLENEKYDLANKYFDPFLIRNYFENVGWVLEYYFPLGEDLRKTIFSSAESLSKQKSAKSLNLWLRLLNQKTIKSELEKQDAEIAKPLFNIQRKTYSELLKNKQACSYSFYSLLKLGDEQKIYLDQLNSCLD
jgi:hypothetical protein